MKAYGGWLAQVRLQIEQRRSDPDMDGALGTVRLLLRQHGFAQPAMTSALAVVGLAIERSLGKRLSDQQLLAAALILDQALVELPTGEGKTLALAAAASVAGLAGVPTHIVTANEYLAARDAQAHAALWQMLGLRVTHTRGQSSPQTRREAYRHDLVYTTAKDLAFDHLRDHLHGPLVDAPVLQGLNLALLDEADSILLDEAVVPLVISGSRTTSAKDLAQRRAVWWQAMQLAARLNWGLDAMPGPSNRSAQLTASGLARLTACCEGLPGIWQRPRLRKDLIELALSAMHQLVRDRDYLVTAQGVELLDGLSGRVAQGRVWSQGLQSLIELKEGLPVSAPTDTLAQTTFQRFFGRYWRLGGLSGTLVESRAELQQVYGLPVIVLPPGQPSRRVDMGTRVFDSADARWACAVDTAAQLRAQGRPVLIGTDSVLDSDHLSARMQAAGLAHDVLNARHDHIEADIVRRAGQAGAITIATRMAGRGTDIGLDPQALAAGGLHVIHCQRNESGRLDRQLLGRAARQGQPGSSETWIFTGISADQNAPHQTKLPLCSMPVPTPSKTLPGWIQIQQAKLRARTQQWTAQQRQATMRKQLQDQDQQWEIRQHGAQPRR
jgi:preprotein translocase subunit SecA